MDKDKIKDIVFRESDTNKFEYTTEEMISVIEYYEEGSQSSNYRKAYEELSSQEANDLIQGKLYYLLTAISHRFNEVVDYYYKHKDKLD